MAKKAASPKSSKAKETSLLSPSQPKNKENVDSDGNDKKKTKVGTTTATSPRPPSKSSPNKKTSKKSPAAAVSNRKRKASSEEAVATTTTISNDNDDKDVKTSAADTTRSDIATSEEQQEETTTATATNAGTEEAGGSTEVSADNATDDTKPAATTGSAAATSKTKPEDDFDQAIDLTKPIKRARTAYFIFSDEHRAEIQAKHKGEGVAVVAKEIGQMWSKMSVEEKEVYKEKAAMERDRVAQQLAQLEAAGIDLKNLPGAAQANTDDNNSSANANGLIFPLARIRKTIKLDPEVKNMSKEALMLVTKCTELMTGKLGIETVRVAQIQNRRTLMPDDVANVTQNREQFLFLKDDVKDLVREQVLQKQNKQSSGSTGAPAPNSKEARAIANSKPLTAYFAVAPKD